MCPYFTMRIWVILLFCTIEDCCIWNSGIERIALVNQTKLFAYMNQIQYQNRKMECMDQNGIMPKRTKARSWEQCPHARAIPMSKHTNVRADWQKWPRQQKFYLKLLLLITLMLLKTNWQKEPQHQQIAMFPTNCSWIPVAALQSWIALFWLQSWSKAWYMVCTIWLGWRSPVLISSCVLFTG